MIARAIMLLVPLLHFSGYLESIPAFPGSLSSFLWPHGLIIELHVDAVSRECEGLHNNSLHGERSSSSDDLSDFATPLSVLNIANGHQS